MWNVFPREVCIYLQFPKCVCSPHLLPWHELCFFFLSSSPVLILPSLFSVLIITFCFPPYPQARPLSWTRGINNVSWVWILHLKKKKTNTTVRCSVCMHLPSLAFLIFTSLTSRCRQQTLDHYEIPLLNTRSLTDFCLSVPWNKNFIQHQK